MESLELGSVVFALKGRDKGRFFAVTEIVSDQYVKIADGETRTLDKPKLKKLKHLKLLNMRLEKVSDKLAEGAKVFDKEIKSALRAFNG